MTKYRGRSRDMELRQPEPRFGFETDEFMASYHGLGLPIYECADRWCMDRWIEKLPEVTWLIGGKWYHFHYECQPRAGNLALEIAGRCGKCGTLIPLSGWGPRDAGEGFVTRTDVCPKCITAWILGGPQMAEETFETVEEFEAWYAANSQVSVDFLHEHGRYGAPCDCGDETCTGWQMKYADD